MMVPPEAKQVGEYIGVFDPSLVQAKQQGAAIADKIAEEVEKQNVAAPGSVARCDQKHA